MGTVLASRMTPVVQGKLGIFISIVAVKYWGFPSWNKWVSEVNTKIEK